MPPRPASPASPGRRGFVLGGGGLLAGGLLAGCEAPLPPLHVGSIVFPGYELLFMAREGGLLDRRRVRLVEMRAVTDTVQALAIGQLEAATLTLDEFIGARTDGIPLRIVALLDESAGADAVIARPPARRPADLAGKRIGYEAGAVSALMLAALLDRARLRPSDVHKVPITQSLAAKLFDDKDLDAVITTEPWASELESRGAVRVFDSTQIPGRIVDVLAVREDALQQRPDAVRHLVAAHFAALRRSRSQPDEAARLIAPRLHVAPEKVAQAFRGLNLLDEAANAGRLGGEAFIRTLVTLQELMLEQRLLPRRVAIGDAVDARFLPQEPQ